MKFGLKLDLSEIKKMERHFRKDVVPKAAARAINRAADSVRAAAVKEISAATKIPQRDVRKRITVRGASPSRLEAIIEAYPYAPNLGQFRATQNKVGVAASAWEKRKTYKHAFKLPSGKVVTRTTNKRYPLKGLRGPSVRKTFMQERVIAKLNAVASQRWRSEFERELVRRSGLL